jgi:hypothetical protein
MPSPSRSFRQQIRLRHSQPQPNSATKRTITKRQVLLRQNPFAEKNNARIHFTTAQRQWLKNAFVHVILVLCGKKALNVLRASTSQGSSQITYFKTII